MRRKRFQKGSVRPRKHGRHKVWVGQWWEDGNKKSKVLGRCADVPKSEAEALMALILKPKNERAGIAQRLALTFGVYLEDIFLPLCKRKWKESTRMTTEPRMRHHLLPAFGSDLLTKITREQMQVFLDQKATTLSRSVVDHLRWDLQSIFTTAQAGGLVDNNPATGLFTPACKPEREKRVMTPQEIRRALGVLGLRERLMFRMAVFDGMRPGEIFGMLRVNIRDHSVLIDQRAYRGNIDTPKGRKGKRTSRTVALSPGTLIDLNAWIQLLPSDSETYLFPSERGTPLLRDNVWYRAMKPQLETMGLEWATFQVLRRTNASLSRQAKIDDKVAADQRGHGLGVSLEVYSISDLQQKIDAVTRLESEVIQ